MPDRSPLRRHTGRPTGSATGDTRSRLLDEIRRSFAANGVWPGRSELAATLGIGEAAVTAHRRQLIKAGELPEDAANPDRAVRVRTERLVLPVLAQRDEDSLTAPDGIDLIELVTGGDPGCVCLVADDDRMRAAGIRVGDVAVIRRQSSAPDGSLAVVEVAPSASGVMQRLLGSVARNARGRLVLERGDEQLALQAKKVRITGVVISVIRRLTE